MFFYIVLGVVVACNLCVFLCLWRAFGPGRWAALFVLWFALIVLTWYMRHRVPAGAFWSWALEAGFTGIGFSAVAAFACLGSVCVGAVLRRLPGRFAGAVYRLAFTPRRGMLVALFAALALSGFAVWEAGNPRPVHLVVPTRKLPAGVERFRIAAVSDIHLSRFIGPDFLRKIAAIVNGAKPDLFVTLGDVVDTDMRGRQADAALLLSMRAPYGSYGVLGNHESYRGLDNSLAFYEKSGITLLRGHALAVGPILLAGLDDPVIAGESRGAAGLTEKLTGYGPDRPFTLLLNHRPQAPEAMREAAGKGGVFDLMLSGHTHGGQMQPMGAIFTRFVHNAPQGMSEYAGGLRYVSNGAGYWGPPMRLFAQPEVLIIDLVPESSPPPAPRP